MISIEIQIALDAYMLDRHAKSVHVRDGGDNFVYNCCDCVETKHIGAPLLNAAYFLLLAVFCEINILFSRA